MKSNYLTAEAVPQSEKPLRPGGIGGRARPSARFQTRPLRLPAVDVPVQPVVGAHRETLRALRAAELAAWEAVRPSTRIEAAGPNQAGQRLPMGQRDNWANGEVWMMLVLVACALAALAIGTQDLSAFLSGWFRFADNIQNLLG